MAQMKILGPERCLELSKVTQPGELIRWVPRPGVARLEEGKVKSRMLSARLRSVGMLHLDFQMDTESCEPARQEAREMWFLKWKRMTLADVPSPEGGGVRGDGGGSVKVKNLLMHREQF